MYTIIGGGFAGLSAAYFLHRAGKDVTLLEWSRGLGGRASTRNVGYRTMDSGAQRIDLSPLSVNKLETDARALLREVAVERGVLQHLVPFPGPVYRFDGRSIGTAHQVETPNWSFLEAGMKVFADALVKDIPVRTHTRISDIVFEKEHYQLRNQRGELMQSDGLVIALPAPYALALLLPHAETNKKVKKITDLFNDVNYEPMIGAMFGTTKIDFKEHFSALFTDDVTAPIFWLSQENIRRPLGIRKNEMAFVLQLGAEISHEYVLKTDRETFIAIERVFEEVLDVALPDITYGEIQRWPAAFLASSPFTVDTIKASDFKVPLYLAGDYVAGQSSMASAFWSGKQIADRILGEDTFKYIAEPKRDQARLAEEAWKPAEPTPRAPRKSPPKPQRKHAKKKFDAEKGKRITVQGGPRREKTGGFKKKSFGGPPRGGRPQGQGGPRRSGPPQRGGQQRQGAGGGGGWQRGGRPQGQGGRPSGPRQGGGGGRPEGGRQWGQGGGYQGQGRGYQGQGGGYQGQGQGGGYRGGGRPQGGSRPQGGGGGRQWGQGGGQGGGYGGQGQGGYGGRPQRPGGGGRPQGGPRPQGGGGYQPRQPRDYNSPQGGQGGGGGQRRPVRGQVVYSTNVRQGPREQGGGGQRGGGYRPRGGYDGGRPGNGGRYNEDDNIGNR